MYRKTVHIIDENIFDQAQFILNQRSSKNEEKQQIAKTTKGSTLLSGNIYCAHCGQKMVSTSYIDRYDRGQTAVSTEFADRGISVQIKR